MNASTRSAFFFWMTLLPFVAAGCRHTGSVHVSHPRVFGRSTLADERLRDVQWLEGQYDKYEADRFSGFTDVRRLTATTAALALGLRVDQPELPASSGDTDFSIPSDVPSPKEVEVTKAKPDNIELLNDKLAYRDRVAAAIHDRMLDDGHDANGGTIYDLGLSVSLNPGDDVTRPVVVMLELSSPCSTSAGPLEEALTSVVIRPWTCRCREHPCSLSGCPLFRGKINLVIAP